MKQLGPYQLLRSLGEGGMGHVYLASLMKNGWFEKWLAIKTIKPELSKNDHFLKLFEKEAQMAAMLNHQHIVQIFDFGYSSENDAYLVMEYINGVDLREVLERVILPLEITLEIMIACCKALDYASRFKNADQTGLIHRDISPHNILLGFEGEIKLIDFGLIQFKGVTQNHIEGKIGYMSPEQARHEPLTFASDLFSLGIVFYECLTGTRVYPNLGGNLEEALKVQSEAKIIPIEQIKPDLHTNLVKIIHRLLAVNLEDRYQQANELYEDLKMLSKQLNVFISGNTQSWLRSLFTERFQDQIEKLKNAQQTLSKQVSIEQVSTVSIVSKLLIQDVTESIVAPISEITTSSVMPIQEDQTQKNQTQITQTISSVIPIQSQDQIGVTQTISSSTIISSKLGFFAFAFISVVIIIFVYLNMPSKNINITDQFVSTANQTIHIKDQAVQLQDQAVQIQDQSMTVSKNQSPKKVKELNHPNNPIITKSPTAMIHFNGQSHTLTLKKMLSLTIEGVGIKFRLEPFGEHHYELIIVSQNLSYQFNRSNIREFPARLKLLPKNELIILKDSNLMVKLNIELVL
jgi:serine/threonine-protein kinase